MTFCGNVYSLAAKLGIDVARLARSLAAFCEAMRCGGLLIEGRQVSAEMDEPVCELCLDELRELLRLPVGRAMLIGGPPSPQRSGDRGLGDTIHRLTTATGINQFVHRISRGRCGCERRREWLNRVVPYR